MDPNGHELWRWSVDGGEMGYALHPQGIVYILQADYINNSLFTLFAKDETTGQDRFPPIQLPMSQQGTLQPYSGLPSVLPDGNLYLPVEHADDYTTDKLDLLKVAPDGTYTWIPLFTGGFCGVFGEFSEPHEVIPYGTDKFLVIWDKAYFQSCQPSAPSEVAVFTTDGHLLNQYPIPLTRLGSYFSDNDGDVALGTEGNGYITGAVIGSNIVTPILSFNVGEWKRPVRRYQSAVYK